jgi:tetratricopeptide (TPR) repeat protein
MTRRPRPLAFVLLAALVVLAVPSGASAEVLRLKTGETIKGRVVAERTNETLLVVEDFATGAIRELSWDALVDQDEQHWKEALGMEERAGLEVACEVITVKVGSGTDVVTGVVESEGDVLKVRSGGRILDIEKARVVSREKGTCDPTEIWNPDDLYEKKAAELAPADARAWFLLAKYAERVGAYPQAKTAYESAAADPEFPYAEQARSKVAQLAALIRDKEAFDTLRDLKIKLNSAQFNRLREGLETFFEKHPEAGDAVKKSVETLKEQFKKAREKALSRAAGDQLLKILERMIRARVKEKEVKLNEVLGWTKKTLTEEALAELAKTLQRIDASVTPEEARTLWDARPKKDWKRARYGSGTFIVEPPKIKPPSGGSRSGGGGGPGVTLDLPKPPTRDGWWEKASVDERVQWVLAHFVETSGLFEVSPKKDRSPCDRCLGQGMLTATATNGQEIAYLCPKCGGAQTEVTIKFR